MWRLNKDGTIDECDDTPDEDKTGLKYRRSLMRKGRWAHYYYSERWNSWTSKYIDDCEVPKIIKMMDLLDP